VAQAFRELPPLLSSLAAQLDASVPGRMMTLRQTDRGTAAPHYLIELSQILCRVPGATGKMHF